jgi:SOS-response transcriptional repressor LexA
MLTKRQNDLLQFLIQYEGLHGSVGPTYQEMADGIGVRSKSSIDRLLKGLEAREFIKRIPFAPRSIAIIRWPDDLGVKAALWHLKLAKLQLYGSKPSLMEFCVDAAIEALENEIEEVKNENREVGRPRD